MIPTVKVLVTFTKFEELQPLDEFITPPSSPTIGGGEPPAVMQSSSSSWFQWIKSSYQRPSSSTSGANSRVEKLQDPFAIPSDYAWITTEEMKKKMKEKGKLKKAKN